MCLHQDPDIGPRAVEQVRRWGGVLEHPKGSRLFERCGLPRPGEPADSAGGVTFEVSQVHWGHVAEKRTLLYVVGHQGALPVAPFPDRVPTHWVSGSRNANRKGNGGVVPAHIKVCSAPQRRRTPQAFAQFLVEIARGCNL